MSVIFRECEATESLSQETEMWSHHTHENGYNPHCIFLFLLKNIGFDSTVLLDFLISSETCFLEYFVRYLKLLQKDWDNFFTICKYFDVTESKDNIHICCCISSLVQDRNSNSTEASPLAVLGSHTNAHSWVSWTSAAASEPLNHGVTLEKAHTKLQANCLSTPGASPSLVDYDSSDDSEEGSTSLYLVNSRLTSSHQEATKKTQDTFGVSGDKKELSPESQSRPLVTEESNTRFSVYCDGAPNNTASEVGISYRTVKCFEELQGAIYRLQKKSLFPYNPTALLKLLKHIETIYNKSMTPL